MRGPNAVTTPLLEDLRAALADRLERPAPSGSFVPSAVLALVYPSGDDHKVLLHKRSQRVVHHKGDIAFPGGVQEEGESLLETALRETHEEIGVDPADVEVLGETGRYGDHRELLDLTLCWYNPFTLRVPSQRR